MQHVLALLGIPMLVAITSIWRGYVLTVLWRWFLVPAFHAPAINLPTAIGLCLVIGFLTHQAQEAKGWTAVLALSFIGPALSLLTGWVVTWFM